MKHFLYSLLGSMTAIWLSLFIAVVGITVVIAAAGVSAIAGASKPVRIDKGSYLAITLAGEIDERPGTPDPVAVLQGDDSRPQGLDQITGAILAAADDDRIEGISIEAEGAQMGTAMRQSLIDALLAFKNQAPHKWIYAYGDNYTQGDYMVAASVADSLFVNPVGIIDIHGLAFTGLYFKDALDKLGIDIQVVKVGTYKSAIEPFTLNAISEPARRQQQLWLDGIWSTVSSLIASGRGVDTARVNSWADGETYALPQQQYVARGIADGLKYRHEYESLLMAMTGCDDIDDLQGVAPADYCNDKEVDIDRCGNGRDATIAVLYATGDITDDTGDGIVASALVPEIFDIARDDDIDALVLRVNSGGGSAYASEQIWEALQQFKAISDKPFYVSMSDYAASGGYYISCGADSIFAQPTTVTGSIGIFGLIPDVSPLLEDKLGVHTSTVKTNSGSGMPTILTPMTPAQRTAMQAHVDRGYQLFVSRCAQGRGLSTDSIKAIAEGRVWDGRQALALGLVDELGGLDDAIKAVASRLGAATYTIERYPRVKDKWYELLLDAGIDLRARWLHRQLGDMAPIGKVLESLRGISVLQARMETVPLQL